jgi:alpha-D-ribose 1-methylphosphonate 5-triphosphate synthase subunit PhnL
VPPILKVEGLTKHFLLHEQRKLIPSCSGVTMEAHGGELTALVGPTGSGKSSVMKCVYRTYLPTAGRMLFRDATGDIIDLAQASEHHMLELRSREIGFVTQFLHCLPRRSALDVASEPMVVRGASQGVAREKAAELLALLDVPERLWGLPPATFSGGEKQRINLVRGLIARPRLLLLDEPTASLDFETTDKVVRLLTSIKKEGLAMIAIFHQPELVRRLADRVVDLQPPATAIEPLETYV